MTSYKLEPGGSYARIVQAQKIHKGYKESVVCYHPLASWYEAMLVTPQEAFPFQVSVYFVLVFI